MDPSRTTTRGREACHAARDAFFEACALAAPAGAPPPPPPCPDQRAPYEALCLPSWRTYWEERVKRGRPLLKVPAVPARD